MPDAMILEESMERLIIKALQAFLLLLTLIIHLGIFIMTGASQTLPRQSSIGLLLFLCSWFMYARPAIWSLLGKETDYKPRLSTHLYNLSLLLCAVVYDLYSFNSNLGLRFEISDIPMYIFFCTVAAACYVVNEKFIRMVIDIDKES